MILKSNVPKALALTIPRSSSRIMIGLAVPHLLPVNRRVLRKYTSALNGELKPNFHDFNLVRIGMLSVVSVCFPGPNVSPNSPR